MSDLFLAREPSLQGAQAPVRYGGVLGKCQSWLDANRAAMRVIATLFSANMLARLASGFSILMSVLLFAPAEFARFGMLLAALTLGSPVQFLRYDTLIVASRTSQELRLALRLTAVVGFCVWIAMAVLAGLAVWAGLIGGDLALLFLGAMFARALCRIGNQIVVRGGGFRTLGRATVILTSVQPFVLVTAWLLGASGTVAMGLTDIVGNLAASVILIWSGRSVVRGALTRRLGDQPLTLFAHEWRSVPMYNLPSTVLAAAFISIPLLAVLHIADAHVGGLVALVFRILDVPVQIIAAVISPVVMNRFHIRNGQISGAFGPILVGGLAATVFLVFGGICVAAVLIEPLLVNTQWKGLSHFLPQVAFFQASIAFAIPLVELANLRRNQRTLFAIQITSVLSVSALALLVTNWQVAVAAFGMVAALRALLLAAPLLGWRASRQTV